MGLLAGTAYDPASAGSFSTAAAAAMAAIDTTNLRLTFTAPAGPLDGSGKVTVRVRLRGVTSGATTAPSILFGVLDHSNGDVVKARQAPICLTRPTSATNSMTPWIAEFPITGLTPGASYTFDAALGVETGVASTALKYGGPNDSTASNAFGAVTFEIYDAFEIIACTLYDPSGSAAKSVASAIAMTALDTTNLRLTFNAPPSGNVIVRMGCPIHGGTATGDGILFGVLDGATVRCRQRATFTSQSNTQAATDLKAAWARMLVTGLTAGQSYTWDAAYDVEQVGASESLVYGGLNDSIADNAFGGFFYEILDPARVLGYGAIV